MLNLACMISRSTRQNSRGSNNDSFQKVVGLWYIESGAKKKGVFERYYQMLNYASLVF